MLFLNSWVFGKVKTISSFGNLTKNLIFDKGIKSGKIEKKRGYLKKIEQIKDEAKKLITEDDRKKAKKSMKNQKP